jgi:serpin B
MIRYKNFILLFTLFSSLLACDKTEITPTVKNPSSNTTTSYSQIVEGNSKFAINIYKELVDETKNQLLSPYSISTALAIVYAGADANTATEIQSVFGFNNNNSSFHQTFNQVTNSIETNVSSPAHSTLNVVNKIWRSPNLTFLPDFNNTMTTYYLAPVDVIDFTQTTAAKQLINEWVSQETHQLIPELLPDGFISPQTATVLVNALYFKADWLSQFPISNTSPHPFNTTSAVVNANMMSQLIPTNELKFTEDADAEVLELFFKDKQSSIVLVLPKNQTIGINDFVQQALSYTKVNQWLQDLAYPVAGSNFDINIPKWDFESDFDLVETLDAMGMQDAFSPSANFSKMTQASIFIDKIKHKAVIKAHEGGVEAAAATAVGMTFTSIPPVSRTFLANRPFVFLIKDTETNSILFIGHVQDPTI